MKIERIRTYLIGPSESPEGWGGVKAFLFVRIDGEDGTEGWGEAYVLAGRETAVAQMVLALGRELIGRPASPRSFRAAAVQGFADKRMGIDFYCALSALELALWDLEGKRLGAPVHRLLGGALRERVPLYANIWSDRAPSLDGLLERGRQMTAAGFRALKIYPLAFPSLAEAEACVAAFRKEFGAELDLMIDLNALDDPYLAIQAGRRFAPYDPFWFEEPVTSDDPETLHHVGSEVGLRLVTGERHGGKYKFRELLERRAADVLNPDIAGCGGILEFLEIAALAESFSVQVTPHNYNTLTLGMAAMLQVSALVPNLLTAEYYPAFQPFSDRLAEVDWEITEGQATLPQSPGLGVAMKTEALEALAVCETV